MDNYSIFLLKALDFQESISKKQMPIFIVHQTVLLRPLFQSNSILQLLAWNFCFLLLSALRCCNKQFVEKKKMRIPKTLFLYVSLLLASSLSVFDMFTNKAKPVKGGPRLGLHLSAALSNSSSNIALHPAALLALLRALHHCGCSFIERERIVRPPILPSTLWALARHSWQVF